MKDNGGIYADEAGRICQKPGVFGALLLSALCTFCSYYVEWSGRILSFLALFTIVACALSGILWIWATAKLGVYDSRCQALAGKRLSPDLYQFSLHGLLGRRRKWAMVHTYSGWLFIVSVMSMIAGFLLGHSRMKEISEVFVFPTPLLGLIFGVKGGIALLHHHGAGVKR